MRYCWPAGMAMLCGWAGVALAATVTFDLAPLTATTGNEVVVLPGQAVEYQLTAIVASDTEVADNHGLEAFTLSIQTDSGVAQPPLDAFDPLIAQNFPLLASPGTAQDDDVLDISASQSGLGTPFFEGIGVGQVVVLATGRFNTPTTETTFTVKVVDNPTAFVIGAGSADLRAVAATGVAGPGFTIRTSNAAGGGGTPTTSPSDGTSNGGSGGGDQSGTGGTPPTETGAPTQSVSPTLGAIGIFGGALLALVMAYALFGPMGLALGLILIPLLAYVLLLMGG